MAEDERDRRRGREPARRDARGPNSRIDDQDIDDSNINVEVQEQTTTTTTTSRRDDRRDDRQQQSRSTRGREADDGLILNIWWNIDFVEIVDSRAVYNTAIQASQDIFAWRGEPPLDMGEMMWLFNLVEHTMGGLEEVVAWLEEVHRDYCSGRMPRPFR